jgi:hypothetical protein
VIRARPVEPGQERLAGGGGVEHRHSTDLGLDTDPPGRPFLGDVHAGRAGAHGEVGGLARLGDQGEQHGLGDGADVEPEQDPTGERQQLRAAAPPSARRVLFGVAPVGEHPEQTVDVGLVELEPAGQFGDAEAGGRRGGQSLEDVETCVECAAASFRHRHGGDSSNLLSYRQRC